MIGRPRSLVRWAQQRTWRLAAQVLLLETVHEQRHHVWEGAASDEGGQLIQPGRRVPLPQHGAQRSVGGRALALLAVAGHVGEQRARRLSERFGRSGTQYHATAP